MRIYSNAVKRPITTMMIFLGVLVLGVFSMVQLPIDLYPEIEPPFISVMTTYPGASASDVEENVSRLLEDGLNSVDKLKEISSVSYENLSVVSLEFQWEANLDEASNDVRSVIDLMRRQLPDGAEDPQLFKFNTSMIPVLFFTITADESYPGLEDIIEEKVINRLNRIDGIGSVSLSGTPKRMIYVDLEPERLDAYNLTIEQIGGLIQTENLNLSSENMKMGRMDYQLRVEGEFTESEQIKNLVIGYHNGHSVRLGDVAEVRDTLKEVTLEQKINGRDGALMFVMKQSGANTVRIANDVRKELELILPTLPPDIEINILNDTSEFIVKSVNNLSQTLMWAMLFVVLVVLFFLGKWRATFIVVLTIPISLIVSFVYLYITGQSINIISLSSLSIAIGMVVDDAIVVLENITKHIERGSSPREASIYGTNEVWLSVIVTTMVIVAVFFPLTLVGGMTGVMFKQLGWIVTITTVTSTLIAISLTPMLTSVLMKLPGRKMKIAPFSYAGTVGRVLDWMDVFYEKTIRWALRHKIVVSVLALGAFVGSIVLLGSVGTDFMPQTDESFLTGSIELQTGLRVEETAKVAFEIEKVIGEKFPEVTMINSSYGSDDEGGFMSMFRATGSNLINLRLRLKDPSDRERDVWSLADALRSELDQFPEIVNYSISTSGGAGMGDNNVAVEIYGYDFDVTNRLALEVSNLLKTVPGASDVQISRDDDKPEFQIYLDQEKLSQVGLNTATVATSLRNRIYGLTASYYKEAGDEYSILVRLKEESRNSISKIENLTITNAAGTRIKLKEIGRVEELWSPPNIERKRRERYVTVSAVPAAGVPLGTLAEQINEKLKEVDVPSEVMISVGGTYKEQQESFADLGLLMLLSLVLVYLVMASQFESFKMPFIIMFSIPFAFSGVFIALWLTGTTLSVVALLGAVMLIGIVVKNGIVLVDYINLMRERGVKLYEAIALSCRSRLRPVLMTAFTTILGMLPMALSRGEGAEIWSPMGIAVIGGLLFSTVVTMIIIPVMYASMAKSGTRDKKRKLRSSFTFMDE